MKIEIKSIKLENYKGVSRFETMLSDRTQISGKNAVGKSTVSDAIYDILTGKMADGTTPDAIRPRENGVEIDRIPIERSIVLNIDGKDVELVKKTEQKWQKPRGQVEEVFKGNETSYRIDGFDKKAKDFDAFISDLLDAEKLALCLNSKPFLNSLRKSTADARKCLENASGFSIDDFIASHEEYKDIQLITKGHPIEDVVKQLRRNLNTQKKDRDKALNNLTYEKQREVEGGDTSALEKTLSEKEAELQKVLLDDNTDQLKSKADNMREEVMRLDFEKNERQRAANVEIVQKKNDISNKISEQYEKVRELEETKRNSALAISKLNEQIILLTKEKEEKERRKTELQNAWKQVKASVFDESKLICPTCSRPFEESKKDEMISNFNQSKNQRMADIQKEGQEICDSIRAMKDVSALANNKVDLLNEYKLIEKQLIDANNVLNQLKEESFKIPSNADMSNDSKYMMLENNILQIKAEVVRLEKEIETSDFKTLKQTLERQISEIKAKIDVANALVDDKKRRVELLQGELSAQNQLCADYERQIDLLRDFSVQKNIALADMLKPYCNGFDFKFFDETQDGNIYETCRIMVNGIDYMNGLNHGQKLLTELALVQMFQALNNVNMPIIIDDAESIDDWRIPKTEQQLIILRRTDEEKITVSSI